MIFSWKSRWISDCRVICAAIISQVYQLGSIGTMKCTYTNSTQQNEQIEESLYVVFYNHYNPLNLI